MEKDIRQRLERIEEILVRLEWKLENSQLNIGGSYSSDIRRYCLENRIDPRFFDIQRDTKDFIDYEFLEKVSDWLSENEDNNSISLLNLETHFGGKSNRSKLLRTLRAFNMSGYWEHVITRLIGDGTPYPSEYKSVQSNYYENEKVEN